MADWQEVKIDAATGMDQSAGERVAPLQAPREIVNLTWSKDGVLRKRNGFSYVDSRLAGESNLPAEFGPVRHLAATTKELVAVGSRRLYAYSDQDGAFYDRGPVSPFSVAGRQEVSGSDSYIAVDYAEVDGIGLIAAQSAQEVDGVVMFDFKVRGVDSDGNQTLPTTSLVNTNLLASRLYGPKCCALTGGNIVMVCGVGGSSTPTATAFRTYIYDTKKPEVAPTQVSSTSGKYDYNTTYAPASSAANYDKAYNSRLYDLCPVTVGSRAGGFVFAWIDGTSLYVGLYTAAGAIQGSANGFSSVTTSGDPIRVSVAECVSHSHSGAELGIVVLIVTESESNRLVRAAHMTWDGASSFVVAHGWQTLETLAGATTTDDNADCLGCVEGVDENGASKAAFVWEHWDVTTKERSLRYSITDYAFGAVQNAGRAYNAMPKAKPFNHGGRFYVPCDIGPGFGRGATGVSGGWQTSAIIDLGDNESTDTTETAAYYHVGQAQPLQRHYNSDASYSEKPHPHPVKAGSLNSISVVGNGFRYVHGRLVEWLDGVRASSANNSGETEGDPVPRHGANLIRVDPDTAVTSAVLADGAAVFSGGFYTYYSGHESFELGHHLAPMYAADVDISVTTGGELANVLTGWMALWAYVDTAGVLHRGWPCPRKEYTPGATNTSVATLAQYTYPALIKPSTLVIYRDTPSYTMALAQEPTDYATNKKASISVSITDEGTYRGPTLYVTAGQLESVGPEGGRTATVALGRLWLGGLVTGTRFQYSKVLTPGTASEIARAPEFHEDLGALTPDGRPVMAIGDLDDKAILLTDESIYMASGYGPDNAGEGPAYQLVKVASGKGCKETRSVVSFKLGLAYQTSSGIELLDRGLNVSWLGKRVRDTLEAYPTITSAVDDGPARSIRFTCHNGSESVIVSYNYDVDGWSVWKLETTSPMVIAGAAIHGGVYYVIGEDGRMFKYDSSTYLDEGNHFPWSVDYHSAQFAEFQRVGYLSLLGKVYDDCVVTVEMTTDLGAVDQTDAFSLSTASEMEDVQVHVVRQKCRAKGVKITGTDAGSGNAGFSLSAIVWRMRPKHGQAKVASSRRA